MKMNLFKAAIMSLALMCGAGVANAQMGQMPSPDEMAKMQADDMKTTVNLNDDQYNKVVVVFKEQTEKMQKAFQEGGQPDFMKMIEERNNKLKEILTDEQYKKWEAHERERFQNMQGGFGGGGF